jgi:hypothetical protein
MYIYHNAGLMLPLALVTENCTSNEYADGLMAAGAKAPSHAYCQK